MGEKRVLRTRAAAEYLGLSPSTLEKMRARGTGPRYLRLGGRSVGYDRGDLDAWLDGQRIDSTGEGEPSDAA